MARLDTDLRELLGLFAQHGVEYVLVGGHAVAWHGHPRYTADLDLLLRRSPENAARVLTALQAFGFGEVFDDPTPFLEPGSIVQLGRPPNRVDLLTKLDGVSNDQVWAHAEPGFLDDVALRIIDRGSLIATKRASGRPKDLADLDALRRRS